MRGKAGWRWPKTLWVPKIRHSSDAGGGALRRTLRCRERKVPGTPGGRMHPEMLRQLINQHNRETIARVQEDRLASRISRALRSQRRHGQVAGHDNYAIPAIPDFVDGSL